jgi:tetratricopeptide (TPR) repeat protein
MTRRDWLIGVLLFLVTFAAFSRVLLADFVQWDDPQDIYQNPHLTGLNLETLRWMFTDLRYVWRYTPCVWLTREVIYEFQGAAPFGYHLVSLVAHSLNAVWLFVLIRKLLPLVLLAERDAVPNASGWVCPALGAMLWALHPLRVEAVAWAAGYLHCQSLFFMLLSLWLYLEAVTAPGHKGRRWRYWLSVLFYLASLFSFPTSLGLVPVLVILDIYPLNRFGYGPGRWWNAAARRIWLEKAPFVALALLAVGIGLLARFHVEPDWPQPVSLAQFSLFARAMQACYVWVYFLWKPWMPFGLSPVYTTLVGFNPVAWPFWLSAGLLAGVTGWLVWQRRQWPWALALWVSHLVLLVPVLGLTEHPHFPSDRYSYGAGILWSVLIASVLLKLWRQPKARAVALLVFFLIAAILGALSFRQTKVWRNSEVLFQQVISELGNDPYRSDIQWRLGSVLASEGKWQEAAQQYETSLSIQPTPVAHLCLAELLARRGDRQGALTHCLAALALGPTPLNRVQAGQVLAALGRGAEAINQYRQALVLVPDLVPALNNLALILATDPVATNRNGAEAVQLAERACVLTGRQIPVLVGTLAAAYAEAGRFKEAIETARQARDLAHAAGQPEVAEKNRQLLELYRAGKAYRDGTGGVQPVR